jgi:hypothetical protein
VHKLSVRTLEARITTSLQHALEVRDSGITWVDLPLSLDEKVHRKPMRLITYGNDAADLGIIGIVYKRCFMKREDNTVQVHGVLETGMQETEKKAYTSVAVSPDHTTYPSFTGRTNFMRHAKTSIPLLLLHPLASHIAGKTRIDDQTIAASAITTTIAHSPDFGIISHRTEPFLQIDEPKFTKSRNSLHKGASGRCGNNQPSNQQRNTLHQ